MHYIRFMPILPALAWPPNPAAFSCHFGRVRIAENAHLSHFACLRILIETEMSVFYTHTMCRTRCLRWPAVHLSICSLLISFAFLSLPFRPIAAPPPPNCGMWSVSSVFDSNAHASLWLDALHCIGLSGQC